MDIEKFFDDIGSTLGNILPLVLTGGISGIFLLAGAVVVFFGGLVAYIELFPSKSDRVVKATIKGVRSKISDDGTAINYPVFEYVDSDGITKEAESFAGSSSLADKVPGTQVRIRLSGTKQGWATQLGMSGLVLGVGFLLFGVFLGWVAIALIATLKTTTFVMWGLVFAYFGNRVRKMIIPKGLRETKEAWMSRKKVEADETRKSLPMLGRAEVKQRLEN